MSTDTIDTKAPPPVTHSEAREIMSRFNNSHFRSQSNGETARYSIPARPEYDDDLRMEQYIKQNEADADRLAALEADARRYRWLRDDDNFPADEGGGPSHWDELCELSGADFAAWIDEQIVLAGGAE